jgi:predicted phosphoribosyltransferase
MMFEDRFDAAHQLAHALMNYKDNSDVIILAIPRGGLELGSVLAHELHAPLDIVLTKKIGAPGNPEYALGAVSLEGALVDPLVTGNPDLQRYVDSEIIRLRDLLRARAHEYRGDRPPLDVHDKIVIVVDDGVATGRTMHVALNLLKKQKPKKLIVALPVAPLDTLAKLKENADEVVCLHAPSIFYGVGAFYKNFAQVEDARAIQLLKDAQ